MYAVIKSGGKQYKVREGDTLRVEKIDVEEGGEISLDDILMVADGDDISVGTPIVAGATVDSLCVPNTCLTVTCMRWNSFI